MLQQSITKMDFQNPMGFTGSHGLSTNIHSQAYRNGSVLSFSEKVIIGSTYVKVRESINNARSRPYIDDTTIKHGVRKTGRGKERERERERERGREGEGERGET